jgi:hypothetical protein
MKLYDVFKGIFEKGVRTLLKLFGFPVEIEVNFALMRLSNILPQKGLSIGPSKW